jgi:hypothetical protein
MQGADSVLSREVRRPAREPRRGGEVRAVREVLTELLARYRLALAEAGREPVTAEAGRHA